MTRRILAFGLAFALMLCGCGGGELALPESVALPAAPSAAAPSEAAAKAENAAPKAVVTLLAAGDNLIHDVIYNQARERGRDGGYDFAPDYRAVAPMIAAADLAVINQETILASEVAEVSSYPMFCSPTDLGEQLLEVGFDVFTGANNHSYDKGAKGVRASLEFWDKHPQALAVGMYRDAAEREKIHYTTVKGVKFAFLAAAEQTNGLTLPASATEGVYLLADEVFLRKQLDEARRNADFVVFSPHWGTEGTHTVNDEQRRLAGLLVQWGADLVLGAHPHVLQPCETVTRSDGTKGLVIYSLGNFISAQKGTANMAGGLLSVTVEKREGGRGEISDYRMIPTVTHYGDNFADVRIIPLADYTPQLAAAHGVRRYQTGFDMDYLTGLYEKTYPGHTTLSTRSESVPVRTETPAQTEAVPMRTETPMQTEVIPTRTGTPMQTEAVPGQTEPPAQTETDMKQAGAAPSQTAEEMIPAEASSAEMSIGAAIDTVCKAYSVTGMSLAVFRDQEVVYSHSYGYANREKKLPAAADTVYRTASIAKAVTAMTAMTLYDEGAIALDGDISAYTGIMVRNPKYPDIPLTPRQLMTHTSGVVDSDAYYAAIEHTPFIGLSKLMSRRIFSSDPPGSGYVYSNLSAGMVGCVAAGAAKEPLWTLAKRQLFDPLGLSTTYLSKSLPDQSKLALIYSGKVKTFDPVYDGTAERYYSHIPPGEMFMLGNGDLFTTAADLAKLGMVLAGDGAVGGVRVLKADTVKAINSVQFHADAVPQVSPAVSRGLGVQLLPGLLPGRDFAGHQGNAYGMISCLFYEPQSHSGFVFLSNGCYVGKQDGVVYDVNKELAETVYRLILH